MVDCLVFHWVDWLEYLLVSKLVVLKAEMLVVQLDLSVEKMVGLMVGLMVD